MAVRSVAMFGAAVLGERGLAAGHKIFDGIGEMGAVDMVIAARDADLVSLEQHIGVTHACGGCETIGGKLDPEAQGVAEIERIHETTIDRPRMFHPACVQPFGDLCKTRLADIEGEVM